MTLVNVEIKDRIAFVTLNRPEARNALNLALCHKLSEVILTLRETEELALVTLTGAGEAFCAGADLHEIKTLRSQTRLSVLFDLLEDIVQGISNLPVPVLALINGPAIGAGLELAAAADMRVCSLNAKFGVPALKLGLCPTPGMIKRLSFLIGPSAAAWVIWSAKLFTPQEALGLGLVAEVWQPADTDIKLELMAEEFRKRSVSVLETAKRDLWEHSWGRPGLEQKFENQV